MRLSFFRSKSDVDSPRRDGKLRSMLSPGRAKSHAPSEPDRSPSSLPAASSEPAVPSDVDAAFSPSAPNGIYAADNITADAPHDTFLSSQPHTSRDPRVPSWPASTDGLPTSDANAIDEQDMHRRLLDLESSFLPNVQSSNQLHRPYSASHSTLFATNTRRPPRDQLRPTRSLHRSSAAISDSLPLPRRRSPLSQAPRPASFAYDSSYRSPPQSHRRLRYTAAHSDEDELDYGDSPLIASRRDYTNSSPSAAAAARYKHRTLSTVLAARQSGSDSLLSQSNRQPNGQQRESDFAHDFSSPRSLRRKPDAANLLAQGLPKISTAVPAVEPASQIEASSGAEPSQNVQGQMDQMLQDLSQLNDRQSQAATSQPVEEQPNPLLPEILENGNSTEKPPGGTVLQAQNSTQSTKRAHARHLSTVSSVANQSEMSADALSEGPLGVDDVPQIGVHPSTSVRASQEISRVPSFGSIASSMSAHTEVTSRRTHRRGLSDALKPAGDAVLSPLSEEAKSPLSDEITPRRPAADPTDTVIAQHVRDIQVPNTIARNFREANAGDALDLPSTTSTPFLNRAKNSLTLKEQNSKVDKLSKENFDLKLKIHYLHQALQDRSDEGLKDLVSRNAELQADLLKAKKEIQTLKKKLRELERQHDARNDNFAARGFSNYDESEDDISSRGFRHGQMEEEILYLRDRMQYLERENVKLRDEGVAREFDRRRLQAREPGSNAAANAELEDALRDETSRRQRAEEDLLALRAEHERLLSSRSPIQNARVTADRTRLRIPDDQSSMSGSTMVEQLKHENAELRRDLGAQTSMLTSRNRERERLQQEIENLKLYQRRGDATASAAGDSILDRSVSQNNIYRPLSSKSGATRESQMGDMDREQFDRLYASVRDENASLRMRVQDMQREISKLGNGFDDLQAERDDAIRLLEDHEIHAEGFKEDAMNTINGLEELVEDREMQLVQMARDLGGRDSEGDALRQEIKAVSESLVRLADDREASQRTIQTLESDLRNATGELEALEKALREANAAKEQLEVQAESSQSEIAFLREEQEGDKIKIGDLQSALRSAATNLDSEKDRIKQIEQLQAESAQAQDAARELRVALTARDAEASALSERLAELENGLRATLGDFPGPRMNLLKEVIARQKELETTAQDLEAARLSLHDKDQLLRDRDALLESSGLESRRLSDLLDKERLNRRQEQDSHERVLKHAGTLANPTARVVELEAARTLDRKKLASLELKLNEQLQERNALLISLWNRLSAMCGDEWRARNKLPLDDAAASEVIVRDITTFSRDIILAVTTIDGIIHSIPTRIRATEKAISRDFQMLDSALEKRMKRLDKLERIVRAARHNNASNAHGTLDTNAAEIRVLKDENRQLRNEIRYLKRGTWFGLPGLAAEDVRPDSERGRSLDRHQSNSRPTTARSGLATATSLSPSRITTRSSMTTMTRQSALEPKTSAAAAAASALTQQRQESGELAPPNSSRNMLGFNDGTAPDFSAPSSRPASFAPATGLTVDAAENGRLVLQLKEMQRRLKAEREGRLIDRNGARKRLEEGRAENDELRRELDRMRVKR